MAVHLPIAQADPRVGEKDNGLSSADERYLVLYEKAHRQGFDVGRNLLDSAWSDAEPVADERITESTATLERWLNPPEPTYESYIAHTQYSAEPVSTKPAYSVEVASGYANASTVACESGGDYAIDTGNGYYGGYQFDSQTWDAYGDSGYAEANLAPPAAQDAAAASVPYDAWPNC